MQIYLIRHGETDWNLAGRCQGKSDQPLNETGRRQAQAIAECLSGVSFEAFYSSNLCRALETARIIAQGHGHLVHPREALRELDQGEFEGLSFAELKEHHAVFLSQWRHRPAELAIPGGESLRELQNRASTELEEIVRKHPEGKVAVVAHNLCNAALLCWAMKIDLDDFRRIRLDVASINIIEFPLLSAHPVVIRLNDTCHL